MANETRGVSEAPSSSMQTRSSLGLFSDGLGSPTAKSPAQRHATVTGTAELLDQTQPEGRRRRASRRQSEDTMHVMRSLDRQYGRRRRLNSDYHDQERYNAAEMLVVQHSGAKSGASRGSLRRGDSRALFAPVLCQPQAETVVANRLPEPEPSSRRARQLMLLAGKLAQHSLGAQETGVRPRASMPLINGAHRAPQRTRSHVSRQRDELADALTMKSVEIRGGRIMLDNPSSSDEESGSASSFLSEENGNMRPLAARQSIGSTRARHAEFAQRQSIGSVQTEPYDVEDMLRRQWYARRCLGLRQPFDSVHRLAKAEHDSGDPFPLLNDLRRVLLETHGCRVAAQLVDVLLCTDAIVVCAHGQQDLEKPALRAVEFTDDLVVRAENDNTVRISGDQELVLEFSGGALEWVERVVQARDRLATALQDLRLDEEDYIDRPPLPLLARGRSSIAGTSVSTGVRHPRMRNGPHGGVYWVPDNETSICMVCQRTAFSMMVRRHHCRLCGLVICYRCSKVDGERRRLCVRCSTARPVSTLEDAGVSPSLHTLGRRAAEYLPAGDVVMQIAALHEDESKVQRGARDATEDAAIEPVVARRKAENRLARRPISSLFSSADPDSSTEPA
ncbi:hypothetical protein GGI25_006456 [Coemansia spiralis]|uniref:FYVE-type domain-containing protein n=2 Tax=Coemansia TaxID=4863 RepID=A0A9W8FWV3_9FUNG|nr:hypothetical protein BX070DRAFT_250226 [Coemansia spiralis]KAJ1989555.1 hypothetical protein EDC05_004589 [Coemansia umbellata]KAJ2625729.1 hypothetical protein GGI26_000529 [Coemansia sp. RSA 1358]KAJ2668360.1 hypothetical protein GGI25_006456 [Coemansia spiralis]